MAKNLLIVESPSKAKTLKNTLAAISKFWPPTATSATSSPKMVPSIPNTTSP